MEKVFQDKSLRAVWLLTLAHKYYVNAMENLNETLKSILNDRQSGQKSASTNTTYLSNEFKGCINTAMEVATYAEVVDNKAYLLIDRLDDTDTKNKDEGDSNNEGGKEAKLSVQEIISNMYQTYGNYYINKQNYYKAVEKLEKSVEIYKRQDNLLDLAEALRRLPIDSGGGLFGSAKKKDQAETEKRNKIKSLILEVMEIDCSTRYGLEAGEFWIENFGFDDLKSNI